MQNPIETDVLIIGGGGSGLTASLLLSSYGVDHLLVSKYAETSRLPKAHLLSLKTMEIYRELGLDATIRQKSCPPEQMSHVAWFAGLKGEDPDHGREIARFGAWGRGGLDRDWFGASDSSYANLMQAQLEPMLRAEAETRAPGKIRFFHELKSFAQDEDGVTAQIEDREKSEIYTVRAKYLLACDGGQTVGPQLGARMEGEWAIATTVSVHFEADLSDIARASDVLIRSILNPDTGVPGVLVPMGPDHWGSDSEEWVFHMLSFPGDHKNYDDDEAVAIMTGTLGLADIPLKIHQVTRWPLNATVTDKFRVGRAFILGDAAHRMPPSGGHGLNSAVQDVYNLAWKLALVLRGRAGEALLETYGEERQPVARLTVDSAFANWGNAKKIAAALGVTPDRSAAENWARVRLQWAQGPEGDAARRRAAETLAIIRPTYNHLPINFSYVYTAGALVPDDRPAPAPDDPICDFRPSTKPGHSLPHAFLADTQGRYALNGLVGAGRFVLIAGERGEAWRDAARKIAARRDLALDAFTLGVSSGDRLDLQGEFLQRREFGPSGAILVRPDRFVGWRAFEAAEDAEAQLEAAFTRILAC